LQEFLSFGFRQTGSLLDPLLDLPHAVFHHPCISSGCCGPSTKE
jgi:hypothetical protein